MSSNVVWIFQAKPDQVGRTLEFLTSLQDRIIEAGALTASLIQDQDDPGRILELDVWQSVDDHKRFVERATAAGTFKPLDAMLTSPFQVSYLDTVKFSRSRRR